jgi:membrane protein YqaA with SNARE-associated domain
MVREFIIWAKYVLTQFSYIGVFLIGIVSSSTIFLPLPADAIIFFAATKLNPFLVGILAGIGAGIGEVTGYLVGAGGRLIVKEKKRKRLPKLLRMLRKTPLIAFYNLLKKSIFLLIIFMCFVPFAFDFIGIFSGAVRYDMKKFLLATIIGKTIRYLLIAFTGYVLLGWLW